jgi:hypothetical protein
VRSERSRLPKDTGSNSDTWTPIIPDSMTQGKTIRPWPANTGTQRPAIPHIPVRDSVP